MQQEDDFNFWLVECRNYGLTATKERLLKQINEFDHNSYQFAMSPDAQIMFVLIESEKECEDDDI